MSDSGETVDAVVVVKVHEENLASEIYMMPLSLFKRKTQYLPIGLDGKEASYILARIACVSFVKGTSITLSTVAVKPLEDLSSDDRILMRDAGVQEIRWIDQSTSRATGKYAPVEIKAGALHNTNDLVLAQSITCLCINAVTHWGLKGLRA